MITSVNLTIAKLKQIHNELLFNKTDNVSDISNDSVLNAIAFANSKVAQKAIKDIAIVEAQLFPDTATGVYLDQAADLFGVSERRGAVGSSTYVKVVASDGTAYVAGVNNFINTNGIIFELEEDFIANSQGFGYAKVRSVDTGTKTNIEPNSLITVSPAPAGHTACTNEYIATGGIDEETDEVFRLRIKNNLNILSIGTLEYFNQIFQNFDARILRVFNLGVDELGKRILSIVTQNGVSLTENELSTLLENSKEFFPITDLNRFGNTVGVKLQNVEWYEVGGATGIDFRVNIDPSFDSDAVRQEIQIGMSKYLDFRFWQPGGRVEWDDLLEIVKGTSGVRSVPDNFFNPRVDEVVSINKLPRIKEFVMRDLQGNVIFDSNGVLSPIFYPSE